MFVRLFLTYVTASASLDGRRPPNITVPFGTEVPTRPPFNATLSGTLEMYDETYYFTPMLVDYVVSAESCLFLYTQWENITACGEGDIVHYIQGPTIVAPGVAIIPGYSLRHDRADDMWGWLRDSKTFTTRWSQYAGPTFECGDDMRHVAQHLNSNGLELLSMSV